ANRRTISQHNLIFAYRNLHAKDAMWGIGVFDDSLPRAKAPVETIDRGAQHTATHEVIAAMPSCIWTRDQTERAAGCGSGSWSVICVPIKISGLGNDIQARQTVRVLIGPGPWPHGLAT